MKTRAAWQYTLVALIVALSGTAMAADETESRVSESRYYSSEGREQAEPDRVSTDEFTLTDKGRRSSSQAEGARPQGKDRSLATLDNTGANIDFWIYSADVELFADEDRDGYFSGIDLLFDADTVYGRADVYAVVYLSLDGGPWLEYADTEDFVIHGTSANDEFTVVTELLAGYPTGDYDVLIELYDAFDNTFVADMGPAESSELSFLPLEDAERDIPVVQNRTVVVNTTSGGGSMDFVVIAALLLLTSCIVLARRRRSIAAKTDPILNQVLSGSGG